MRFCLFEVWILFKELVYILFVKYLFFVAELATNLKAFVLALCHLLVKHLIKLLFAKAMKGRGNTLACAGAFVLYLKLVKNIKFYTLKGDVCNFFVIVSLFK